MIIPYFSKKVSTRVAEIWDDQSPIYLYWLTLSARFGSSSNVSPFSIPYIIEGVKKTSNKDYIGRFFRYHLNDYYLKTKKIVIKIDPYYFRPNDVQSLLGDASKLYKAIKWKPRTSFKKYLFRY